MLRYIVDPANAITASGLVFSGIGLFLALGGHLELAIAMVLWAMLADHLDGVVAKRTKNRPVETGKIGKNLDGFSDLVYGAVFPAIVVIALSGQSPLSLLTAVAIILAGAIRLSHFGTFGLSTDGRFMGVPLSYDVPLLAVLFLARPLIPPQSFVIIVNIAFLAMAALHVASIRIAAAGRAMYFAVTLFSIASSSALALRGLG